MSTLQHYPKNQHVRDWMTQLSMEDTLRYALDIWKKRKKNEV